MRIEDVKKYEPSQDYKRLYDLLKSGIKVVCFALITYKNEIIDRYRVDEGLFDEKGKWFAITNEVNIYEEDNSKLQKRRL